MKKKFGTSVLSIYEQNIISNCVKSKGDKISENSKTLSILNCMLDSKIPTKLEDGTTINPSALELIIASAINNAIKKGDLENLKTIMELKGEFKKEETHNLNINFVDKSLLERAND